MRYYDITHTLNGEVPIWPGHPLFLATDSNHRVWLRLKPSSTFHGGSHWHSRGRPIPFLFQWKAAREMDLLNFIGDCLVLDCPCSNGTVEVERSMGNIPEWEHSALSKTPNSHRPYHGPFHTSFSRVPWSPP